MLRLGCGAIRWHVWNGVPCRLRSLFSVFAGISIASGSWYDEEDWGLKYPEPRTFVCPSNLPITSVYSEFKYEAYFIFLLFVCDVI